MGTTVEGVHLGAMAGTIDILQRGYAGLELRGGTLRLNPRLPSELPRLQLEVVYRGQFLEIDITHDDVTLQTRLCDQALVRVAVADQTIMMSPGTTRTVHLQRYGRDGRSVTTSPATN